MPDLPRRDRLRTLDERADDRGEFAELLVAEMYDVKHEPDRTDWYDCRDVDTGTKYEVKSTELEIGDDYPAPGRYRLWQDQHVSLLRSDAGVGNTAWYVFVLFEDRGIRDVRRMRPSTVTQLVEDDGGEWNLSGHRGRNEENQHKIPYTEIH